MARLTSHLVQTAYKVSLARNEWGDTTYQTAGTGSPCMYRDISLMQETGYMETVDLDGLLWFDSDETVAKGDVYLLEGQYLKIERIIVGRSRLRDNDIEFYKCEVTKQRQVS